MFQILVSEEVLAETEIPGGQVKSIHVNRPSIQGNSLNRAVQLTTKAHYLKRKRKKKRKKEEKEKKTEKTTTDGPEGRRRQYLTPHCHNQNDTCIKVGSDESHFNVSLLNCDGQSYKAVSTLITTFEEKGQPKPRNRTKVFACMQSTTQCA